jgi:hypothetical protein
MLATSMGSGLWKPRAYQVVPFTLRSDGLSVTSLFVRNGNVSPSQTKNFDRHESTTSSRAREKQRWGRRSSVTRLSQSSFPLRQQKRTKHETSPQPGHRYSAADCDPHRGPDGTSCDSATMARGVARRTLVCAPARSPRRHPSCYPFLFRILRRRYVASLERSAHGRCRLTYVGEPNLVYRSACGRNVRRSLPDASSSWFPKPLGPKSLCRRTRAGDDIRRRTILIRKPHGHPSPIHVPQGFRTQPVQLPRAIPTHPNGRRSSFRERERNGRWLCPAGKCSSCSMFRSSYLSRQSLL